MRQAPPGAPYEIDPASDTPLYQQIAESIRAQIGTGALSPGDALEPLREAADRWGVNLHTVRHAYTSLARAGLIETGRGPRGTRVSARSDGELATLIDRLIRAAGAAGVAPEDLAERVRRRATGSADAGGEVYIVECSAWQCASHASQVRTQWDVAVRLCVLGADAPPPAGATILATYFHYNDLRRLWPERLRDIHFVTIAPRAGLLSACDGASRVVVLEADEPTAANVAADLRALAGADGAAIAPRATSDVAASIAALDEGEVAVLAPRVWSALPEDVRARPDVLEIVYELDRGEVAALGAALQWRAV